MSIYCQLPLQGISINAHFLRFHAWICISKKFDYSDYLIYKRLFIQRSSSQQNTLLRQRQQKRSTSQWLMTFHFMTLFGLQLLHTTPASQHLLFFNINTQGTQLCLYLHSCRLSHFGNFSRPLLKWTSGSLFIIYFQHRKSMGNQNSKMSTPSQIHLLDQLCSLTLQDYLDPYSLSSHQIVDTVSEDMPCDMNASLMVDEAEETQPLGAPLEPGSIQIDAGGSSQKSDTQQLTLQKNQICKKQTKKIKKIPKAQKPHKQKQENIVLNPQQGQNALEEGMRDQNNCKSYHKLVKNYLIEQGLEDVIDKYQTKYHTKYYFTVCLLLIKYHLQHPFFHIYSNIVKAQLEVQQKKIDKKNNQLNLIKQKMEALKSKGQQICTLKTKQANLLNQIQHIKVVKFQIENYSVRSCRAFFQGEIEESLKILYLKNDPVMRKKYYFEQALEVVKNIQSQMRKMHSHP